MRLLNTESLELSRPFVPNEVPDYAIFSHRWNTEEVTFVDISNASNLQSQDQLRTKNGFAKIQGVCKQALKDGYAWIWIDSCCIDKSSSAELQEAINSMWRYYAESNVCYAYLADIPDSEAGWGPMFAKSEWFTRGWTLQELIAPTYVEFYAENWVGIGTKFERAMELFSTAERLSWASHREVTWEEDEAYSLLGLFNVNMPLLYGEGREKAFIRLQKAIYNATADQSLFLFRQRQHMGSQPLLADSPTSFCDRADCFSCSSRGDQYAAPSSFRYRDIVASERWRTQAHEQILTTVTRLHKEMSTKLQLLDYREVSNKLEFLIGDTIRGRGTHVTDVVVLNHTLKKYPKGALCLLIRRELGIDACLRVGFLPAVLPYVSELEDQVQKTKLLFRSKRHTRENGGHIETVFSVGNGLFHAVKWYGYSSDSPTQFSTQPSQYSEFKIQVKRSGSSARVSCYTSCSQDPGLFLIIQLVRMHGAWSIETILESEKSWGQEECILHFSEFLVDRCSVEIPDGKKLSVKLRRLPGSARTLEGLAARDCYQISIDYL